MERLCGLLTGKRRFKDSKLHFAGGQLYPADSRVALGGTLDLATCWPRWKAWAAGLEWKSVSWLLGGPSRSPS